MNESISKYEVTQRELARGRNLKIAAVSAPLVLTGVPAVLFTVLAFLFGSTPPVAFTIFVVGIILTAIGFVAGLAFTGYFAYRYSTWTSEMREKIAADGIKAEEIEWFRAELKSGEKKALRSISGSDALLADAYRETLASRLTATRIVRSSKRELSAIQRRRGKIKQFKTERGKEFREQIEQDAAKVSAIHDEAKQMLAEAEARLQMIEAAAVRGRSTADNELALKKLSTRAANLPLALEEARLTQEMSKQLEAELEVSDEAGGLGDLDEARKA